ncbi:MAG: TrmH family RNA methyltransferase [Bryobacterales bacterium]|nr:RNA methyltransferase [Bryobacteraceae bacterium]MDW8129451.1 TrmH family RNA methyltransferase [Bryobacterales bacterium]
MIEAAERDRLIVVLVAPRNPLNIGAAARAMSNFGFSRLRVVNPYEVAFREARSAVGAAELLQRAEEFASLAEAVADCGLVVGAAGVGTREPQLPVRRLELAARLIHRALARTTVAVLFGSEKFGLSNEDLSHCHWILHIPTRPEHESMNLGQAVAVCLWELARQPAQATRRPAGPRPASAGDLERLTNLLLEALELSGYLNPLTAASTRLKTRRLVRRLTLDERDATVLTGMLRQILWKLRGERNHEQDGDRAGTAAPPR